MQCFIAGAIREVKEVHYGGDKRVTKKSRGLWYAVTTTFGERCRGISGDDLQVLGFTYPDAYETPHAFQLAFITARHVSFQVHHSLGVPYSGNLEWCTDTQRVLWTITRQK